VTTTVESMVYNSTLDADSLATQTCVHRASNSETGLADSHRGGHHGFSLDDALNNSLDACILEL
jgi:hypothetical protein